MFSVKIPLSKKKTSALKEQFALFDKESYGATLMELSIEIYFQWCHVLSSLSKSEHNFLSRMGTEQSQCVNSDLY